MAIEKTLFLDEALTALQDQELTTLRLQAIQKNNVQQSLSGHTEGVSCVAVLADGRVVSGSADKTLKVWDMKTGQCVQTLSGHTETVSCVAVLPDGRVVSGSVDKTLKVWDIKKGMCVQTLKGHKDLVRCVTVLPDGQVVSGSNDKTLKVWNVESGKCLQTLGGFFSGHTSYVFCVAVLPDGRVVSGSYDKTLKVWNVKKGICVQTLSSHPNDVLCVGVLPDGRVVSGSSCGAGTTLKVWDMKTGQCVQTLTGHTDGISYVAVLPDGRIVSGAGDAKLKVWNVKTGQCVQTLSARAFGVYGVAVLPDGRVVSGSADNTLKVWELEAKLLTLTPQDHATLLNAAQNNTSLTDLDLSGVPLASIPQGLALLTTFLEHHATLSRLNLSHTGLTDAMLNKFLPVLQVQKKRIQHFIVENNPLSPTALASIKSYNESLKVLFLDEAVKALQNQQLTTLTLQAIQKKEKAPYTNFKAKAPQSWIGHKDGVLCATVLLDGQVISGSVDNTLKVWDVETGQCVQTLSGHTEWVRCVTVLPDGRVISGSRDQTLKVWDVKTGTCVQTLSGHRGWVQCVVVLPDGRVSSADGAKLQVWDVETGQCVQTLSGHTGYVSCVAVLPDGRVVVNGSVDNTLEVWDLQTGLCVQTLNGHTDIVQCVAVLPDGRVVSGSHDYTLKVWNVKTGTCVQTLSGHMNGVNCVAVLPDGRVISGSCDKIKVWDMQTGICVQTLSEANAFWCIVVLPDGRVISGSHDYTLKVWEPKKKIFALTLQDYAILLTAVQNNTSLTHLNLSRIPLADIPHGVNWLISIVEKHPLLENLDLSETGLTDEIFNKLFRMICTRKRIEHLNVEGNPLLSQNTKDQVKAYYANLNLPLFSSQSISEPVLQSNPYVEKSWHFDPQTKAKRPSPDKIYELVEATEKDKHKVIQFYQHHPVPGYDIALVHVIYNADMNHKFSLYLKELQQRDNNPAFKAKWPTGQENQQDSKESDVQIAWRAEIHQQCLTLAKPYQDSEYPAVNLLPMWHGTKKAIVDSIFKTGYANLATTDAGYFGKGIYGAYEAEYSHRVYADKQDGALILNWTAFFSAYPVIYADMEMKKFMMKNDKNQDVSIGNYSNYDAHFIPVVPRNPDNPNEVAYFPTKPKETHTYTELVVFQSAACLPRYLVELQPMLVKPMPSVLSSGYSGTFLSSAQQKKEEKPTSAQYSNPNSNMLNN